VNQALASGITEGSVAALNFSNKLFLIGTGVFAMAITTYLLPGLSRLAALKEYSTLKQNVRQALKITLLLLTPVMLGLIILRVPVVQIILERGAFTPEATAMTSGALLFFALGTLGFAGQEVLNKAFYALQDSKTPMKLALVSTGVNVILSLVLVRWMGLNGLALSNAIGYTVLALLLWRGLQIKWRNL
jgi:putative peptidoglycan lipid II flippase